MRGQFVKKNAEEAENVYQKISKKCVAVLAAKNFLRILSNVACPMGDSVFMGH